MDEAKILIELQKLNDQIGRIVSDIESEKRTRKERNKEFDQIIDKISGRVHILEDDKIKKDLMVWIMLILGTGLGSLITIIIQEIIKN